MKDNAVAEVALELVRKDAHIANLEEALRSQDRAREAAVRRAEAAEVLVKEKNQFIADMQERRRIQAGRAADLVESSMAQHDAFDKAEARADVAEQRAAEWEEQARIEHGHWVKESTVRDTAEQRAADAERLADELEVELAWCKKKLELARLAHKLATDRADKEQVFAETVEIRAEAAEAALAEAHIDRKAWIEMHERLGEAGAAVAEEQKRYRQLRNATDVRLACAKHAAAQELSALRAVAEAVTQHGVLDAAGLRAWADDLKQRHGYGGALLHIWLHSVADALAALDAAREEHNV